MLDLFRVTPEGSQNGHLHDAQAAVLVMVVMLVMLSFIALLVTGTKESASLWAHNLLTYFPQLHRAKSRKCMANGCFQAGIYCQRRLNIDPPCRSNIDPGRVANS